MPVLCGTGQKRFLVVTDLLRFEQNIAAGVARHGSHP
jgi:hypothetical protein